MRFDAELTFSQAFRPFFPLAAVLSAMSVVVWVLSLARVLSMAPNPTLWHAHEMLFGFAVAVVLGFVLTAVSNWTGQQAIAPRGLKLLVGLWLTARLAGLWPSQPAQTISALFDVPVVFIAAGFMARVLLCTRNHRNMMFIPFLLGLALLNLSIHVSLWNDNASDARLLLHGSAWLIGFLMVFMGGRVIPFFSGRRLGYEPRQWSWLNWLSTLSALALAVVWVLDVETLLLATSLIAAGSTGLRWWLWSPWRSVKEPMLWILQLGYLWLVLAFALVAVIEMDGLSWPKTAALHALMAGGLGCLGLGMISRVSLGHSGRSIAADGWIVASFVCVVLAGIMRMSVYVDYLDGAWMQMLLSAMLWCAAFLIFAGRYIPWIWCSETPTNAGAR